MSDFVKPADYPEWPEPDLELEPNAMYAAFGTSQGSDARTALITVHRCSGSAASGTREDGWHIASLSFDVPENATTGARWQVHSMDPLTLSPSIQHNCGCPLSHGFIQNGKWVRG